jgi:hypothetical protein
MNVAPSEYSTIHLVVNVGFTLFLAGLGVWFVCRASEEANRIVRLRREWGYTVKDEVEEVAKYRRRVCVFYSFVVVLGVALALLSSIELIHRL